MAAKLLHSLADDSPDLQKQIGCMTGIFQIFDRQHVLNNRRLGQKRLPPPPGDSHFTTGSSESEASNAYHHHTSVDANLSKTLNEKQRLSTESSRASFSSSCSSLSSMDCNKPAQPEASSLDRMLFPETPSRDPIITQTNTSPHIGRQSLDLRDVVKDSMYREARGLSVKTASREKSMGAGQPAKYKDSPRPLQLGKPADGSYEAGNKGKQNVPVDLNESLRVLARLREAPWYYGETRERPRSSYEAKDGSWHTISKDAPRFSYEGRETNRLSFESRDTIKSIPKLKEMPPRLSLDSRENSICSSSADSRSNYLSQNVQNVGYSNERFCNPEQSSQKRPTSVVAKLMGLEALPDSMSAGPRQSSLGKTSDVEQADSFSKSLKTIDLSRSIRTPKSPRSLKEPTSPRWKNPDLIMKPISKLPIEQAPWKQQDGSRGFQKVGFTPAKLPAKTAPFPSVYSEIEKRLKDIEFNQSGKDLRALKQILEAMQSKGLLESRKQEQGSNIGSQRDYEPKCTSPSQRTRILNQQNQQMNHVNGFRNRAVDSLRTYESPIVIMKPAKLVERSVIPDSSVIPMDSISGLQKISSSSAADGKKMPINKRKAKDQFARSGHGDAVNSSERKVGVRNTRSAQSSTRPQHVTKEASTSSAKSSGSVSPRLQQRKLELEKRSRPPTPPSDSNKPRRQSNRQQTEAGSPGGKYRLKSPKPPLTDDQLSQISNESRTSSLQGDDVSVHSDSTAIFDLKTDIEVSSAEQVSEMSGIRNPFTTKPSLQKSPSSRFEEDGLSTELAIVAPEHPSPVSVLDASIYRDDLLSPSPVKQIPQMPTKVDGAQVCNDHEREGRWNRADSFFSNGMGYGFVSEINSKKLQNIENLVQKLRRLNSTHDEASTDYIASLCENTKPDHRYISEILLASGLLLRDLSSGLTAFQLHQSGQPINPELFLVLEQTKASTLASKEERSPGKTEKFHRKLIFDAVNEILVKKLALVGPSPQPWLKSEKLARKTLGAQKLLKELCAEIEQLQEKTPLCSLEAEEDDLKNILWDDIMHRSERWLNFDNEVSGLVLDVERSIFKDLVDEIVIGGRGGLHMKPGRCRQLFAK